MTDDSKPTRKKRGNPKFVKGNQLGFTEGHQKGFTKGQSGNPGGRPVMPVEVKLLARSYTEEAIRRLAYWMRSDNSAASVPAAKTLLDRGWGTAPQTITIDDKREATDWTRDELVAFLNDARARSTGTVAPGSGEGKSDKFH